jgi:UDP-N-acetyl-D-glucosamine dehydrogenase
MVKLLENTFRAVNIGMVNELALMCRDLQVDVWEVIDAASTKPFGFMPFYPGPGLGGHCIPIDPFYLSWKAKEFGFESRFIELAGHVNGHMPRYVVERTIDALNGVSKALRGSRIHLFGIAYKADIDDVRESPAVDVAKLLQAKGAEVTYSDPYVPRVDEHGLQLIATSVDEAFARGFDCAVITTNHKAFDYERIVRDAPLIVDTRNALKRFTAPHVVRL